ncbi:beta-galactosidase domain 4-containing protein [Paenibacillus solisilvae]|uniref:beta-galactosidase n=1 Tax=Paenibacillus solisilvae TaxID=2486751 RepID=A0ABW0W9K2_9BACL
MIPHKIKRLEDGGEYWLHISFTLRERTLWAQAGHEVAWADLPFPLPLPESGSASASAYPVVRVQTMDALEMQENGRFISVTGEHFTLSFDKLNGGIAAWSYRGEPLLTAGPQINLWRAPADNDVHLAKRWREAGYHELEAFVRDIAVRSAAGGKAVQIKANGILGVKGTRPLFEAAQLYTIYGSGDVTIETSLIPAKEGLPPLPRVGLRLRVPERFERFSWFGRGPHECYADRKESGKLGLYEGTAAEQFVPYIKPQENGSKADVRLAATSDPNGTGLIISGIGSPLGQVGVQQYSAQALSRAKHLSDLSPLGEYEVSVDMRQSGIGNHSCGYAPTLPAYLIAPEPTVFAVRLKPYAAGECGSILESRLLPEPIPWHHSD